MKRIAFLLVLSLLLAACASNTPSSPAADSAAANVLTVTDGETQHTFTADELRALPQTEADLNGETYQGVTLKAILEAAGAATEGVTAIKAVATDGFVSTYDSSVFGRDDVILAYSRGGGSLADNEAPFRMVVPGAENRMQARMVLELRVER